MTSPPQIQSIRVKATQNGVQLLKFVRDELDLSGRKSKDLLDKRAVWVNGKRIWMAKHRLAEGDLVEIRGSGPAKTNLAPLEILFEDSWLVAVNKPAGVVSESHKRSVEAMLRVQLKNPRLRALHRLDKDTSGVQLFTTSSEFREDFIECFREKTVEKIYAVLLAGQLPSSIHEVTQPVDHKEAHSIFVQQTVSGGFCRARCQILTGRTHQIRKHAGSFHCRVLGDTQYQKGPKVTQKEKQVPRQMLHAETVCFPSPRHAKSIEITAPWPNDFSTTATTFGLT